MGNAVLPEGNHSFKTGGQKIPVGLKIAPSVAKVADLVYAQIMKWTVWGAQDLLKSNLRGSDRGEGRELALFNIDICHTDTPCGPTVPAAPRQSNGPLLAPALLWGGQANYLPCWGAARLWTPQYLCM